MSEENKTVEPAEQNVQATTEVKEEVKEQPKINSFTQEQLDNIIKQRLEAEKRKHDKQLEEIKRQDEEALKEKEIKEAKSKAELEKLMQQRIAEKDTEILKYKSEIKKHPFPRSIKSINSLAVLRGSQCGYEAAEAFELIKTGLADKAWQLMRNESIIEQEEQEPLPIDTDGIFRYIQQLESGQNITQQDADLMRRGIQSLTANSQTLNPQAILQLLTALT